jgi:small subunit ribosomal protein S6e
MVFKLNISHNGKTYKIESENEELVGKKIGETINGVDISSDLKGYELEITGTSDTAGKAGFKGLEGAGYHRKLLKFGPGMKDKTKGLRLRKTLRGEEISLKTSQINTKLKKEGPKKFDSFFAKSEEQKEETSEVKED